VRGDSLQDLYAKIAAVLGLGLLALSGAVVDYWPVGTPLPAIAPALPRPAPAVARGVVPVLHGTTEPASASLARPLTFTRSTTSATDAMARPHDVPALSDAVVGVAEPAALASAASLELVSETEVVVAPSAPAVASPADDAESTSAPIVFREPNADPTRDDGFFASTVKKTGTSLMRTGASIRGAVRTIGVKVRGVFPG